MKIVGHMPGYVIGQQTWTIESTQKLKHLLAIKAKKLKGKKEQWDLDLALELPMWKEIHTWKQLTDVLIKAT